MFTVAQGFTFALCSSFCCAIAILTLRKLREFPHPSHGQSAEQLDVLKFSVAVLSLFFLLGALVFDILSYGSASLCFVCPVLVLTKISETLYSCCESPSLTSPSTRGNIWFAFFAISGLSLTTLFADHRSLPMMDSNALNTQPYETTFIVYLVLYFTFLFFFSFVLWLSYHAHSRMEFELQLHLELEPGITHYSQQDQYRKKYRYLHPLSCAIVTACISTACIVFCKVAMGLISAGEAGTLAFVSTVFGVLSLFYLSFRSLAYGLSVFEQEAFISLHAFFQISFASAAGVMLFGEESSNPVIYFYGFILILTSLLVRCFHMLNYNHPVSPWLA